MRIYFQDPRTCCTFPDLISTTIMDSCKAKYPMPTETSSESDESSGGKGGKHHGRFNKVYQIINQK